MFLRCKDGFYAGELREFPPQIGLELLRAGRAVNPFNEIEDVDAAKRGPKSTERRASAPARQNERKSR